MIHCGICGEYKDEKFSQHLEKKGSIICSMIKNNDDMACQQCTKGCIVLICNECKEKLEKIGRKKK